jgi:hypothetical protein
VTLPAGLHPVDVSASQGSAHVRGRLIRLTGLRVGAGRTLTVRLKAIVPLRCQAVQDGWASSAWESDGRFPGGHEPLSLSSSSPATSIVGGCLRRYSLRITPGTVTGGTAGRLTLALRNLSSVGIHASSADLVAPAGFVVTHAALASGERGTVGVAGRTVRLHGLSLKSGKQLRVTVTVLPAERCGSAAYQWKSAVQGRGRPLSLQRRLSKRTTSVATTCRLSFATEPHNAVVGQAISGADYTPSGPPVAVSVLDSFGNVVKSATGRVKLGLAENPGGSTLAGTATVQTVGGVASFFGLSLNKAQNSYQLSASSPGVQATKSTLFNENNTANPCVQNVTCQTGLTDPASQMSITAMPDVAATNSGTLSESIDVGSPLQCAGYTQEDPNWYEFTMSSTNRSKTLNYVIKQPAIPLEGTVNAILALTQVCFGAPYDFTTSTGTLAPAGTLPDGSSGYIGLLPTCSSSVPSNPPSTPLGPGDSGPCIASKGTQLDLSNELGFDIVLTVSVPEGLAGDPWPRA